MDPACRSTHQRRVVIFTGSACSGTMVGCLPRDPGCAAVTHVRQNGTRESPPESLICSVEITGDRFIMAVKINLPRLGKTRNPQSRTAAAAARTRRDGRSIEVIGRYHPKE